MKKRNPKKLSLKRITIASLTPGSQQRIKGGGDPDTYSVGVTGCGTGCHTTSGTNTQTHYPQMPHND
ncbi:MAG TPA: class I lanthipeptide [Chitinophaga sp.]|uniref:class I lanthipeptide n=1 Tax=Chitinophaga sp. TaxID=1869181 RepID=UPI002C066100|nr:class I lanthipeptide [Chitinophaga sp.]HVI48987.1 class I lanthipeptide [Chitinophaga sp.]